MDPEESVLQAARVRFYEHRHALEKRGVPCRHWIELTGNERDAWIYPERYQ